MASCDSCGGCAGNCSGCSGCGRDLTLTREEIDMILYLGCIPFLPVGRTAAEPTPILLDPQAPHGELASTILQVLETKRLISIDYDAPLKGFSDYGSFPLRGSVGLSQRGHAVLEILEMQGVD